MFENHLADSDVALNTQRSHVSEICTLNRLNVH